MVRVFPFWIIFEKMRTLTKVEVRIFFNLIIPKNAHSDKGGSAHFFDFDYYYFSKNAHFEQGGSAHFSILGQPYVRSRTWGIKKKAYNGKKGWFFFEKMRTVKEVEVRIFWFKFKLLFFSPKMRTLSKVEVRIFWF